MERLSSFKAYDIRGKVPSELNADLAYIIGKTYPVLINAKKIVIGHDIRKSSEEISAALAKGLTESGVDVIDIGLCGTEMVYYATPALDADGGIMITASHNPPEYNGMKFVKKGSVPVGYDSGLKEMEMMILKNELALRSAKLGTIKQQYIMDKFIHNLKRFYDPNKINKHKIVMNAGNGCAGLALNGMEIMIAAFSLMKKAILLKDITSLDFSQNLFLKKIPVEKLSTTQD